MQHQFRITPILYLVTVATVTGCLVVACGDNGNGQEGESDSRVSTAIEPVTTAEPALLCEVAAAEIQALTPDGAERLNTPGIEGTWTSRMCIIHYGIDAPVQRIRDIYLAGLADQDYELSRNEIHGGAGGGRGMESRMFILGTNNTRRIDLVIDEFSGKTPGRPYLITIQMQLESN